MSTTEAQNWIARVNGGLDNYRMNEDTTLEELADLIVDLLTDIPHELVPEVVREISRYALAKQEAYIREQRQQEKRDREERDREEREDEEETTSVPSEGEIQNAYNEMHEMMNAQRPTDEMLDHFRSFPMIAYEVDKWGWMLLHHAVAKFAPLPLIEAIMEENPRALMVEVAEDRHAPIQIAARCGRTLEVIKALYRANPTVVAFQEQVGREDTAHALACKYHKDREVKAFLYTYRDGSPLVEVQDQDEEEAVVKKDDNTLGCLRESYPVMVVLVAWITMLVIAVSAGVRTLS